jgi:pSer/pThr/pTyr-binding forkhead associated (FHA) protein
MILVRLHMARIILKIKEQTLREIILYKDAVTTIGRDPSSSIYLENPAVSRSHAKIYRQGWIFYIVDLESSNGTFLNGRRVKWKAGLSNNDEITISKYTLIFEDHRSDYEDVKTDKPDDTIIIKT